MYDVACYFLQATKVGFMSWIQIWLKTFVDVFTLEVGTTSIEADIEGWLIGRWLSLAMMLSIAVFVVGTVWPFYKKRQFPLHAIFLTISYAAIWIWFFKVNVGAYYDLPMAVFLTMFCLVGGYPLWKNWDQLHKMQNAT